MSPSPEDSPASAAATPSKRRRRGIPPQWTPEQLEEFRVGRESAGAMLDLFADRLADSELESLRTLHFVGEWSYMMNMLCADLVVGKIPVTSAERDAFADALQIQRTDDPVLPYTSAPEATLAALTVVDG